VYSTIKHVAYPGLMNTDTTVTMKAKRRLFPRHDLLPISYKNITSWQDWLLGDDDTKYSAVYPSGFSEACGRVFC
jgi:hypothetical protein